MADAQFNIRLTMDRLKSNMQILIRQVTEMKIGSVEITFTEGVSTVSVTLSNRNHQKQKLGNSRKVLSTQKEKNRTSCVSFGS